MCSSGFSQTVKIVLYLFQVFYLAKNNPEDTS